MSAPHVCTAGLRQHRIDVARVAREVHRAADLDPSIAPTRTRSLRCPPSSAQPSPRVDTLHARLHQVSAPGVCLGHLCRRCRNRLTPRAAMIHPLTWRASARSRGRRDAYGRRLCRGCQGPPSRLPEALTRHERPITASSQRLTGNRGTQQTAAPTWIGLGLRSLARGTASDVIGYQAFRPCAHLGRYASLLPGFAVATAGFLSSLNLRVPVVVAATPATARTGPLTMRQSHVRFDRSRSDTDLPLPVTGSGRRAGAHSKCSTRGAEMGQPRHPSGPRFDPLSSGPSELHFELRLSPRQCLDRLIPSTVIVLLDRHAIDLNEYLHALALTNAVRLRQGCQTRCCATRPKSVTRLLVRNGRAASDQGRWRRQRHPRARAVGRAGSAGSRYGPTLIVAGHLDVSRSVGLGFGSNRRRRLIRRAFSNDGLRRAVQTWITRRASAPRV